MAETHALAVSVQDGHERGAMALRRPGGAYRRGKQRHLTEVLRCPGAGGGQLPAWRTERACGPLTAGHEKGDTDMKGWAEPEHLHVQPGSQTAWVGEVA